MVGGGLLAGLSIMVVPFAPNMGVLIVALCAYGVAAAFLGTAPAASVGDATGGARRYAGRGVLDVLRHRGHRRSASSPACWPTGSRTRAAFALGAALLLVAATYSLRMPRGLPPATPEPVAAAETVPVGEQQIGGPESDDPTTKDLR